MLKTHSLVTSICLGLIVLWPGGLAFGQKTTALANDTALPASKPLYPDWRTVADADLIVQGTLHVPVQKVREQAKIKPPKFPQDVALRLDIHRTLKGKLKSKTIIIPFIPDNAPYNPSVATVLAANGKEMIVSLVQVDPPLAQLYFEKTTPPSQLYFAGNTPASLLPVQADVVKNISDEVSNQKRIAAYYARPAGFKATPLDAQVKKLIDKMVVNESSQFEAFDSLEALGQAAVPATIRWMDDRRPLPVPLIRLRNKSAQAFEGTRQYSPFVVVDALDAILNQVTGELFNDISSGGTERARRHAVNCWRTFLYYRRPSPSQF